MSDDKNKNDRGFTSTEVGTLIESFRKDLSVVAEGVTALHADVSILKKDVSELKTDMKLVKDVIKIAIPEHEKRITRLELKAAG